jgi:hypothetical protein
MVPRHVWTIACGTVVDTIPEELSKTGNLRNLIAQSIGEYDAP